MDPFYRVPLSSAEALATLAALRALSELGKAGFLTAEIEPGILESAADRIADEVPEFVARRAETLSGSLADALRPNFGAPTSDEEESGDEPPFPIRRTRRLLTDAYEQESQVEIEYFVASRDEWTTRRIDIRDVQERNGTWYLSGHDYLRGEPRLFRLDHIRSVRVLDEPTLPDPFMEE